MFYIQSCQVMFSFRQGLRIDCRNVCDSLEYMTVAIFSTNYLLRHYMWDLKLANSSKLSNFFVIKLSTKDKTSHHESRICQDVCSTFFYTVIYSIRCQKIWSKYSKVILYYLCTRRIFFFIIYILPHYIITYNKK